MTITIALDAMGGDHLAIPNLQGACRAIRESSGDLKVLLCGQKQVLMDSAKEAEADSVVTPKHSFKIDEYAKYLEDGSLEIVDYPEVVEMGESPAKAVRKKRESSMAGCFKQVKDGKAQACVSAGNSGAMMAFGIYVLGRVEGVRRPAILCNLPSLNENGVTVLLDGGANVDCTADQIVQFAQMGETYFRAIYEVETPRVALLNIGEEDSKGPEVVREAAGRLRELMPESFRGYVEGREVFSGDVDVVACDGFVGNVVLKTAEGVAKTVGKMMKQELSRNPLWSIGGWMAQGGFRAAKSRMDYREYGAAPLVGLEGLGLIAHGASDGIAITNAIRMAKTFAENKLVDRMRDAFVGVENGV